MNTVPCPHCYQRGIGTSSGFLEGTICQTCDGSGVDWRATAEALDKELTEAKHTMSLVRQELLSVIEAMKQIADTYKGVAPDGKPETSDIP